MTFLFPMKRRIGLGMDFTWWALRLRHLTSLATLEAANAEEQTEEASEVAKEAIEALLKAFFGALNCGCLRSVAGQKGILAC